MRRRRSVALRGRFSFFAVARLKSAPFDRLRAGPSVGSDDVSWGTATAERLLRALLPQYRHRAAAHAGTRVCARCRATAALSWKPASYFRAGRIYARSAERACTASRMFSTFNHPSSFLPGSGSVPVALRSSRLTPGTHAKTWSSSNFGSKRREAPPSLTVSDTCSFGTIEGRERNFVAGVRRDGRQKVENVTDRLAAFTSALVELMASRFWSINRPSNISPTSSTLRTCPAGQPRQAVVNGDAQSHGCPVLVCL